MEVCYSMEEILAAGAEALATLGLHPFVEKWEELMKALLTEQGDEAK